MQLPYFTRSLLFMTAGPLIWALHFVFIYVLTAIICARPSAMSTWLSTGLLEWTLGIATVMAIAAILWITLRRLKSDGVQENVKFMEWTAVALGAFSIYAIVMDVLPVMFVPACT
jgi:hypothetical protein